MNFQTVEEVRSQGEMTKSLKLLRRIPRPANFLFKATCEALDKKPLLLLARPGSKVNRALVEQLKEGSRPVWGMVRRRGADLLFITRGSANADLMRLKLAQLGVAHGVPLKKKNLLIITEAQGRAMLAVERSVRRVRQAKKPVGFIFKPKVAAFGDSPALLLKRGGAERHAPALGSAGTVEGTVLVEGGKTTFTVTTGSISPGQMVSLLKKMGREYRSVIRGPVVVIGEGAQAAEDVVEDVTPQKRTRKQAISARKAKPSPEPKSAPKKAPQAKSDVDEKRAEQVRQQAKADAARAEEERKAREAAEAERQEQEEQDRARRDRERSDAESIRRKGALPALKKRLSRITDEVEDALEEVTKVKASQEREVKLFSKKRLNRFEDIDALVDALLELQQEITADTGKPDKEVRQLMRDIQREDDIDDAIDEVLEWFEERKEDLSDELGELTEEHAALQKKLGDIQSEIAEIETL
ncbi:MAG: hypothetical protein P8R54_10880 [Myxococcota bacterium]|nr:hypothetical protein [Myxococcota bacterium]